MSQPIPGEPLRAHGPPPPPRPGHASLANLVAVISAILGAASLLVGVTWSHFTGNRAWASILPFALASVGFITTTLLGMRRSPLWLRWLYTVSAVLIGWLNFCLFAALACLLIAAVSWLSGGKFNLLFTTYVAYGIATAISVGALLNARWIRRRHLCVPLPHLPVEWEKKTIALVTDVHCGNLLGPHFSRRLVRLLQHASPDVVLLGGDFYDGALAHPERHTEPWAALQPPWGKFFVTGNHEEFADSSSFVRALESVGFRELRNEVQCLHGLQLIGVADHAAQPPKRLRELFAKLPLEPRRPNVLLMHQPRHLDIVADAGIHLQLSGHTHGGQCWPITYIARRVHGRFTSGLQHFRTLRVFISQGAGTWGPPMRLGTRPEIVFLTFTAETTSEARP